MANVTNSFIESAKQIYQSGGSLFFYNPHGDGFFNHWTLFFMERYQGHLPCFVLKRDIVLDKMNHHDLLVLFEPDSETLRKVNVLSSAKIVLFYRGQEYLSTLKQIHPALYDQKCHLDFFTQMSLDLDSVFLAKDSDITTPFCQKALMIDRDDCTVHNVAYNKDPEKVVLREGITDLINRAHKKNYRVIMISNQSGLARGIFSWNECMNVHNRMCTLLADAGAWLDDVHYAGYIEDGRIPAEMLYPNLRKPRTGMFIEAIRKFRINPTKSIMIGDSSVDMIGGYFAGLKELYMIRTKQSDTHLQDLLAFEKKYPDFHYNFVKEFSEVLLAED